MDGAVKSRPQRPSQCAPTEYPNAGKREQGIEGSFSHRELPWEYAYQKSILDPRDRLFRRAMVTLWGMVAFKPGEHGKVIVANNVITNCTKTHIEISNQHPQSASQQLLSVSLASGISASDSVLHCRRVLHQNSRTDSNSGLRGFLTALDRSWDSLLGEIWSDDVEI